MRGITANQVWSIREKALCKCIVGVEAYQEVEIACRFDGEGKVEGSALVEFSEHRTLEVVQHLPILLLSHREVHTKGERESEQRRGRERCTNQEERRR